MYKKYRCKKCNKTLFEAQFKGVIIKICSKCKHRNIFKEK